MKIFLDFETFSECDLKKEGAYKYAKHPSTELLCLAYSIDGGQVQLWVPGEDDPTDLFEAITGRSM